MQMKRSLLFPKKFHDEVVMILRMRGNYVVNGRPTRRIFLRTVGAGLAAGCSGRIAASEASSKLSDRLDSLDDYATKSMTAWNVPGLAIAVVKDGKVIHAKGYGRRCLDRDSRVDEGSIFSIASVTKTFGAAAIAQLVDRRHVAWDDPVARYLPNLGIDRRITLRHAVRHRSGLPTANMLWRNGKLDSAEILARLHLLQPLAAPGERFIYNNNMYLVAGKIVETVSGKAWREYMSSEIFAPLAMKTTLADSLAIQTLTNVAAPHADVAGKLQPIERHCPDVIAPAGAIHSNVSDLARWLLFHLDAKVRARTSLLSQSRLQEIHTAPSKAPSNLVQAKLNTPRAPISRYGLGWFFNEHHGHTVMEHSGTQKGFVAWIAMIPSEKFGLAILSNSHRTGLNYGLRAWLLDACCGLPERDRSEDVRLDYANGYQRQLREAKQTFETKRIIGTSPSHPINEYTGTYNNALYGSVLVTAMNGHLGLQFGSRFHGQLTHWSNESFRATFDDPMHEDWMVTFRSSGGRTTAMTVKEMPWAPEWYEDAEDLGTFDRRRNS